MHGAWVYSWVSPWPLTLTTHWLSNSIILLVTRSCHSCKYSCQIKVLKMFAICSSILTSFSFNQMKTEFQTVHWVVLKFCRIQSSISVINSVMVCFCGRWSCSYVYTSSNPLGGKLPKRLLADARPALLLGDEDCNSTESLHFEKKGIFKNCFQSF